MAPNENITKMVFHTNKRQHNSFKETAMNHRVNFILVAHLAREMTEQVDRPRKQVAADATDTRSCKVVTVTMDELQVSLIGSTKLVHVV